jgi:acyl carrier protein
MPTTLEQLQALLTAKFSVPPEKVQPDARLDTLGLDSLDVIEVLFEVEEEFKIRVPEEGSALMTATVRDIVESIERAQAAQAAEAAAPSTPSAPYTPPFVQ